ncbi:MAG TPA: endolytic transglycosylase MltG [Bacteroidales bacterium]|nr:endolytic transglycosylase MltG [Bacteroidales bacterium]
MQWIIRTLLVLTAMSLAAGIYLYSHITAPALKIEPDDTIFIHIKTGSTFEDLYKQLNDDFKLIRPRLFRQLSYRMNFHTNINPGRYKLNGNMDLIELIRLLRSGNQTPVDVTFNNIRFAHQLAGRVAKQIEADSAGLIALMQNADYLAQFGITPRQLPAMMIPNTYEFFWNSTPEQFMKRMHRESERFWGTEKRQARLAALGLNRHEVVTLASIVEAESKKDDEKPRVAGVFINRLRRGMFLQADPTVIFATGDFTIRRVLNRHKAVDSPYNTYLNPGLPPGPIAFPSIRAIDAVLNYENHNYYFFCAREDFSGYHNFSRTYREHIIHARRYQQALDRLNIR